MVRGLARKVIEVPIAVVRVPIVLIDSSVISRLPGGAVVHRGFQGAIGVLDAAADRIREEPRNGTFLSAQDAAEEIIEVVEADQGAIAEALLDEEQQRRHVGELAELDDDEQQRQAELMAKHRAQELQEERELKEREPDRLGPAAEAKKAAAKKAPGTAAAAKKPGPRSSQ